MPRIEAVGQVITSTNYATRRLFNFTPPYVEAAARDFLACGITKIEIPEGVLDPENRHRGRAPDVETLCETVRRIPPEVQVLGSYLGGRGLGTDDDAYLEERKRAIDGLVEFFPDLRYAMLQPPRAREVSTQKIVDLWRALADHAMEKRAGMQLCAHNHYDSAFETAAQVRDYLETLRRADHPGLKWGIDTGHTHGTGGDYLAVLEEYADLIGSHFHIKARIAAFDCMHGGEAYRPDRDIWRDTEAERGRGLYGGFVSCADPEIETPFAEIFRIIREKARPEGGVVYGAIEIDNPRQHPRLEVMNSVMYLKTVHGVAPGRDLTVDEIARNVFAGAAMPRDAASPLTVPA
jgi:sugar phosphate isomerase/epimerase